MNPGLDQQDAADEWYAYDDISDVVAGVLAPAERATT
jgi:hypothetical protein